MDAIRVLYDGWPLVHSPLSEGAWHLRTLLALNPEGVQAILALPTETGAADTPAGIKAVFHHTHDRSAWEQRLLARLAEDRQANIIHTTSLAASLLGKVATLVSPAEKEADERSRIGKALGRGGLARATILWPEDVQEMKITGELRLMPPVVHPEFSGQPATLTSLGLPEDFLLVDGIHDQPAALQLLESWTWAAASIGELYPLVIAGLDESMQKFLLAQLPEFHVQESVRIISNLKAGDLPNVYKACTALVHLGSPVAWGNALRNALACGKAIVAYKETISESIVGSAGYLIAAEDLRSFGAAMITVVVDEKAREKLKDAAQERAAHWSAQKFKDRLQKIYGEKI